MVLTFCSDPWVPYAGHAGAAQEGYIVDVLREVYTALVDQTFTRAHMIEVGGQLREEGELASVRDDGAIVADLWPTFVQEGLIVRAEG